MEVKRSGLGTVIKFAPAEILKLTYVNGEIELVFMGKPVEVDED